MDLRISKPTLGLAGYYYLYTPVMLFLCAWINPWIGVPIGILAGIAPAWMFKQINDGKNLHVNGKKWVVILGVLLLWVLLSGIGGYVWQNRWDHFFRNAVFMDIAGRPWPVHEGCDLMVYYLGFWLPAALMAKITGCMEAGWFFQLVYGFIGILIAFLLMAQKIGNIRLRYLLPFILFSGLDILYFLVTGKALPRNFHIEIWCPLASWESNTTLINWVYNQAIPSWVATMMMLNYGRTRGMSAMILALLLLSAPFSVVGLFPLAVYYIIVSAAESGFRKGLKIIFSPFNFLALTIAVPIGLYMTLNSSTGVTFGLDGMNSGKWVLNVLALVGLEILVFIPFIYRQIKNSAEFYLLFITCLLSLLIQMNGGYGDFNWRVELPLNYFMTLQLAIYLGKWARKTRIQKYAFSTVALIAAVTPALETARILYMTFSQPVSTYRSVRYGSAFDLDILRTNFVADSVLCKKSVDVVTRTVLGLDKNFADIEADKSESQQNRPSDKPD